MSGMRRRCLLYRRPPSGEQISVDGSIIIFLNSSFCFGNEWKLNYVVLSTDPDSPILSTDSQNYLQYIPWSDQDDRFPFFPAISSVISLMFSSLGSNANWARPRRQSACGEDAQKPEVLEHNLLELVVIQINAMTKNVVKTSEKPGGLPGQLWRGDNSSRIYDESWTPGSNFFFWDKMSPRSRSSNTAGSLRTPPKLGLKTILARSKLFSKQRPQLYFCHGETTWK